MNIAATNLAGKLESNHGISWGCPPPTEQLPGMVEFRRGGGVVGMIESTAQQLDLTGGEGAERGWGLAPGPAAAAVVCLDAREGTGSTSADGGDGGAERRPAAGDGGDDGRNGRRGRRNAAPEGTLTRPPKGLSGPLGGLGRLVGGGGGGLRRRSRQRCREVAPRGGGCGLRCRRLGGRRHGGDPQNGTCGAQQRARLDVRVVPAANGPIEEGLGCSVGPLEGPVIRLLVEQSLNETPGLPGVDVRRLGAEHRPEGVNDALKCDRLGGGGLHRWGRRPRRRGGWCGGHLSSSQARGRVLRPSG